MVRARVRVRKNLMRERNRLEIFKWRESQKVYCGNWENMTND